MYSRARNKAELNLDMLDWHARCLGTVRSCIFFAFFGRLLPQGLRAEEIPRVSATERTAGSWWALGSVLVVATERERERPL